MVPRTPIPVGAVAQHLLFPGEINPQARYLDAYVTQGLFDPRPALGVGCGLPSELRMEVRKRAAEVGEGVLDRVAPLGVGPALPPDIGAQPGKIGSQGLQLVLDRVTVFGVGPALPPDIGAKPGEFDMNTAECVLDRVAALGVGPALPPDIGAQPGKIGLQPLDRPLQPLHALPQGQPPLLGLVETGIGMQARVSAPADTHEPASRANEQVPHTHLDQRFPGVGGSVTTDLSRFAAKLNQNPQVHPARTYHT